MCAMSVVSDYFLQQPFRQPNPLLPLQSWDDESKQLLREVLQRLDKLDKRLGDIECNEPSKAELRRQLGLG